MAILKTGYGTVYISAWDHADNTYHIRAQGDTKLCIDGVLFETAVNVRYHGGFKKWIFFQGETLESPFCWQGERFTPEQRKACKTDLLKCVNEYLLSNTEMVKEDRRKHFRYMLENSNKRLKGLRQEAKSLPNRIRLAQNRSANIRAKLRKV